VKTRAHSIAQIRSDSWGFTLLEVLIAMTMMTIIAVSLYTSMSIGFRARESADRLVEKGRAAEIAIELMKNMLASSMVPNGILAGEFKGDDERGEDGYDADTLTFFTADYNSGDDERASDIEKVEIGMSTRKDSEERVIVRKITPNLLSPRTLDPDEEVLCGNVRSMNFRYYDGSDWQDEWDSSENDDALPKAVEITIMLEDPDSTGKGTAGDNDEKDLYKYTETIILPCS
jgi:type II secretion system protein J